MTEESKSQDSGPQMPCLSVLISRLSFPGDAWETLKVVSKDVHPSREFADAFVKFLLQQGQSLAKMKTLAEGAVKKAKELDAKANAKEAELEAYKQHVKQVLAAEAETSKQHMQEALESAFKEDGEGEEAVKQRVCSAVENECAASKKRTEEALETAVKDGKVNKVVVEPESKTSKQRKGENPEAEAKAAAQRQNDTLEAFEQLQVDVGVFVRTVNAVVAEQNGKCGVILAALQAGSKALPEDAEEDKEPEKESSEKKEESVDCTKLVQKSLTQLEKNIDAVAVASVSLLKRIQKLEGDKKTETSVEEEAEDKEEEPNESTSAADKAELLVVEEMYFNSVALTAKMNVFTREQNRIHREKVLREKRIANAKTMRTKTLGRFWKAKSDQEIESEFAAVDETLPVLPDIPTLFEQVKKEGIKRNDWPKWIADKMVPSNSQS